MKKFYLGMDIGTDSVGMACTDENYELLRAKGKDLWTVRLFDEAKSAEERRTKRTSRRRLERRKQRIDLLQEVFASFMEDETFFLRLNNSGFYEEDKDKSLKGKYSLFADDDFTDKDFYKKYPTIFHLRKDLIDGDNGIEDLRLYYLALHHIIKYRGHFLFEGEGDQNTKDIKTLFDEFNIVVDDIFDEESISFSVNDAETFKDLVLNKEKGLNDKKREAFEILSADNDRKKAYITLILGGKVKVSELFDPDDEDLKKEKLSFKDITDEDFESKQDAYGDYFEAISAARAIYNYLKLENILKGYKNVSSAMVGIYEKHKSDLQILKKFVKDYCVEGTYFKIFKLVDDKVNNYSKYIGYSKPQKKKLGVKKCKDDEFFAFLKKTLGESVIADYNETIYNDIQSEISNGTFLPKILHADNGLFPHQLNGAELVAILDNLVEKYPEFANEDEEGCSPVGKIRLIFSFKIPYYIGPLNGTHGNSWIVKKESGRITPWNFDKKVDKNASNEAFIKRMTNKCTYLRGKDVLPKCSMYYQAFDVLNQINKIKINEVPISVELKQEFFKELFLKNKKVTVKNIKNYLFRTGQIPENEKNALSISGFDGEMKCGMGSYITLKNILGEFVDTHPFVCEDIILRHTLCTDKQLVEDYLKKKYGHFSVVIDNIKQIKGITSFKDFGRLSKEFLTELYGGFDDVTGAAYSVLERLYNTNYNLNQLLFAEEYSFQKAIDNENGVSENVVKYEDVNDLYVSPLVKRGIWQSLLMVDEYVNAVGKSPDKIFIEVTRKEDKDKRRTVSRKNQLLTIYDGLGKDCRDIDRLLEELNVKTDSQLRSERLYLYFMQLGRCAYSGEVIDLDKLATDLYDVDHIFPRSKIKDDSLDNKVLVLRSKNESKKDTYPLQNDFTNQHKFWQCLKDKGLMSEKKYNLLTRTKPLDGDDFNDFVNRQLVVTNQTVKAVADLLKIKFPETKIVYSKASNVTDFRQRFDIIKCRDINDLHHARDAYLNVVVGNIYDTKFSSVKDRYRRIDDSVWSECNLKTLYDTPIVGAWQGKQQISRVKSILERPRSIVVTRYAYVDKGKFYDETVLKKNDKSISYPLKNRLPYMQIEKYGGFTRVNPAYFVILEYKKGVKTLKTLEPVPIIEEYSCSGDIERLQKYFDSKGFKNPKIVAKLKIKQLVCINGFFGWLAGVSDRILLHNAQQWFTDIKTDAYAKILLKLLEQDKSDKLSDEEKENEKFIMSTNRFGEVKSYIDRIQNEALYRQVLDKLKMKSYQGISTISSLYNKLVEKEDTFKNLTVLKQAYLLFELIKYMKTGGGVVDTTLIGGAKNDGLIRLSKNITNVDFQIISQSPCGLITRVKKI